jgi:predicted phosphate transport protein (TIGR00153 family)
MNILQDLFGKSPFGPFVEYTEKVHECVEMLKPLMEALVNEAYDEIHKIQDMISRLEYEADNIKHEVREHLPRCHFMPVERVELERFISSQDKIADKAEDFAIIPTLRKTKLHPDVMDKFFGFLEQIFQVTGTLLGTAVELKNLAEVSFSGAKARHHVLDILHGLNEEEWKADRMACGLSKDVYALDPITIIFHQTMILTLRSGIANEAENAGDMLRTIIL